MKRLSIDINIETNLNIKINMKSSNTHKLVSLLTVAEQGTFVLLLVLDKRLQDKYYDGDADSYEYVDEDDDDDDDDDDADDDDDDDDGEDDNLDVNIEALTRRALRRLCGELTLLEEQGKEGEERVLVDLPLVSLELGLGGGRGGIMTSRTI